MALKMQPAERGQKPQRRTDQPSLLVTVYTGGGATVAIVLAHAHLDKHQNLAVLCNQIEFAQLAVQIAGKDKQAVCLEIIGSLCFGRKTACLGGGFPHRRRFYGGRAALGGTQGTPTFFSDQILCCLCACIRVNEHDAVGAGRAGDNSMSEIVGADAVAATWKHHAEQVSQQMWPTACLYVVATPIGNLADLSLRAWEALRRCDAIAAEDTRTSRTLLDSWGISTPLLAAHKHNEAEAAETILARLAEGARIALISDAGAPAISDPGTRIVKRVRAAGFRVVPLPGPSAVIAALMASGAGLDDEPGFVFAGFLPSKAQARGKFLARWLDSPMPVVFFETPHRLKAALADLQALAGDTREITIARELSKRFEEIDTVSLGDVQGWLAQDPHRSQGEFVLVLHPAPATAPDTEELSADQQKLMRALLAELSVRDAARIAATVTGLARDRLYAWALRQSP